MSWWGRLWRTRRMEEQLEREVQFHLEQHAADLMALGVNPAEARRQARLAIEGPEQVKEMCRDARGTRWALDFWQDVRYAVRMLAKRPGFTAVALSTLGLGIGAVTVMFTLIDGVLLKPLPYSHPERLVRLREQTEKATAYGNIWAFAYPNYQDVRAEVKSLDAAGWRFTSAILSKPGDAENVNGLQISANFFTVVGVPVYRGRLFTPEDDRAGAPPVTIISYAVWQRRFAGSEDAIGKPVVYNGNPYTVVGVAPAGFRLLDNEFDVFLPLGQETAPYMQNRRAHPGIQVIARLQPGATEVQAKTELTLLARHLAESYPKSNEGRSFPMEALQINVGDARSTLWLLLGAVTFVLLIACVNIASLLLARVASRDRELAMRMALGAGRGRLVRQCLTESAVLGFCGGIFGVLLAVVGLKPFLTYWPGTLPRSQDVGLNWQVLLGAFAVSVGAGVLFGLAPALRSPARLGSRSVGHGSRRMHGAFVVAEITLAVVLLVAAGALGRTLLRLAAIDPGVNVHNLLTARTALSPSILSNAARTHAMWKELLERVRAVPGVEAAAIVDTVPMRQGNNEIPYWLTPQPPPQDQQSLVSATCVVPEYFRVAGIQLRSGRLFDDQDRLGNESVVVIDEVMAHQAFGAKDPIGQHVWIGMSNDPFRVVGVVGHVLYYGPAGDDRAKVRAELYYPFAQVPDPLVRRWSELMSMVVRTSVPPLSLVESLRREVRGGGDQVLYEVRTMEQLEGAMLARQRFLMMLFGAFAGMALLLACIGIYGVLAYLTTQRVPEIGVRMALGATARDVTRMVLGESLGMIAAGIALGTAGALAAGRILAQSVEGMRNTEPGAFVATIAVLTVAALLASYLPARRASKVDPIRALRQD